MLIETLLGDFDQITAFTRRLVGLRQHTLSGKTRSYQKCNNRAAKSYSNPGKLSKQKTTCSPTTAPPAASASLRRGLS